MRRLLGAAVFVAMLLGAAPTVHAQVSIGIRIGPPPPRVLYARPVKPGSDYFWVDGYWYPVGGHYRWHEGYWTRPPYDGARWIGPHYEGGQFYNGYWEGSRGRFEHNHDWDRDRDRDYHRYRHDDDDRDRH